MSVSMKITGGDYFDKALRKLGRTTGRKLLRSGVTAASTVQRQNMRQRVPKRSGTLQKNLRTNVKNYTRGDAVTVWAGTGGLNVKEEYRDERGRTIKVKPSRYFHLVDQDVKPHLIVGNPRLAFTIGRRSVFPVAVGHPGSDGKDLVEKSNRATQSSAEMAFRNKVTAGIHRETLKLAAKQPRR